MSYLPCALPLLTFRLAMSNDEEMRVDQYRILSLCHLVNFVLAHLS